MREERRPREQRLQNPVSKINKPTVNRTTYDVKGATASEAWGDAKKMMDFLGLRHPKLILSGTFLIQSDRNQKEAGQPL
jgi:hypothetical protein